MFCDVVLMNASTIRTKDPQHTRDLAQFLGRADRMRELEKFDDELPESASDSSGTELKSPGASHWGASSGHDILMKTNS